MSVGVAQAEARIIVRRAAEELSQVLARAATVTNAGKQNPAADDLYPMIAAGITNCLRQLSGTGLVGPANRLPSSELWNSVGEILCRGWLQNRARTKPRGYAGDYEMLAAIYQNRRCGDPLGTHFDRYFQEEEAPQAVRHRMRMMADWAAAAVREARADEGPIRVAVVGSAFGLELREAAAQLTAAERGRLCITLLDMDPAALDHARQVLAPWIEPGQLAAIPANVFRLPVRAPLAEPLHNARLLLCAGLFDYLDDEQATAMLRLFWDCLAPGGRFVAFQFAPHNPSRAYMEWLGNWYLIYRTEAELRHLAERAGIPAESLQFGAEPLGIDLFVAAQRPRSPDVAANLRRPLEPCRL